MEHEVLAGGVANAGRVVRVGGHVLRPANRRSTTVHAFLSALRATGFDGVPLPVGIEDERERLEFIPGAVAIPPYSGWVQTDDCLASMTDLIAAFHEASATLDPSGMNWSPELADP